jgi:hypothetical protein
MRTKKPEVAFRMLMCVLLLSPAVVSGQYDLRWANFEDGKFPDASQLVGVKSVDTVSVVDLDAVQKMPPEFRSGKAAKETGKHGLHIKARPTEGQKFSYTAGLTFGDPLDRDQLGENGRALYQADFFLPGGEAGDLPAIAVLAMEPVEKGPAPKNPASYYRFGVGDKRTYFSFMKPGLATAAVYKMDKQLLTLIPRPGWHRFAIVFEGPDTIRCFVDGREASFSPLNEPTLRKLSVGVLGAWRSITYDAYIDNLSTQFTSDVSDMPLSPYSADWTIPAGPASLRKAGSAAATAQPDSGTLPGQWLEPNGAWTAAQRDGKPFLMYFYAPGMGASSETDQIFRTDQRAQAFLARHACTRIDVNQYEGGTIAKKYSVFKVPTFIAVSPDGKAHRRTVFRKGNQWNMIESQLKLP